MDKNPSVSATMAGARNNGHPIAPCDDGLNRMHARYAELIEQAKTCRDINCMMQTLQDMLEFKKVRETYSNNDLPSFVQIEAARQVIDACKSISLDSWAMIVNAMTSNGSGLMQLSKLFMPNSDISEQIRSCTTRDDVLSMMKAFVIYYDCMKDDQRKRQMSVAFEHASKRDSMRIEDTIVWHKARMSQIMDGVSNRDLADQYPAYTRTSVMNRWAIEKPVAQSHLVRPRANRDHQAEALATYGDTGNTHSGKTESSSQTLSSQI